jgi:hypothetical protein
VCVIKVCDIEVDGKENIRFTLARRGSSISIVSDYGLDNRAIEVRSRQRQEIFPLTSVSRPALGPN